MAFEISRCAPGLWIGPADPGTLMSTSAIDTAFVFGASGDAMCLRFVAPVSQTTATITAYFYVATVTGTPDFQMELREGYTVAAGGSTARPKTGGSDIGTSPSTLSLSSADDGTWVSLTITGTLTVGNTYWLIVKNTSATPGSNYATWRYRGAVDGGLFLGVGAPYGVRAGFTLDGFTTDPTMNSGFYGSPVVLKFSSGDPDVPWLLGVPWVLTETHASNSNCRGNRIQFAEDVVVSGIQLGFYATALSGVGIYTTSGTAIVTATGDDTTEALSATYRFNPVTLTGGTSYDILANFASSSTIVAIYTMGEIEANVPADVMACKCFSLSYVDGTAASRDAGTLVPDTSKIAAVYLLVDNFPAISGGTNSVFGR